MTNESDPYAPPSRPMSRQEAQEDAEDYVRASGPTKAPEPSQTPPSPSEQTFQLHGCTVTATLADVSPEFVNLVYGDPVEPPVTRQSVLAEARDLIQGQRRQDYGGATESFERIASLWTAYLVGDKDQRFGLSPQVLPADVCMLMLLLKVARYQGGGGQRDSVVDACGYLGLIEVLANEAGKTL